MKIRSTKFETNPKDPSPKQTDRQRVLNLRSSNVFRISNFVLRISLRQTIVKMSTPPSMGPELLLTDAEFVGTGFCRYAPFPAGQ